MGPFHTFQGDESSRDCCYVGFFPGQTSASEQAAFHRAGNVLAQRFFAMTYNIDDPGL